MRHKPEQIKSAPLQQKNRIALLARNTQRWAPAISNCTVFERARMYRCLRAALAGSATKTRRSDRSPTRFLVPPIDILTYLTISGVSLRQILSG